MGQIDNEPRVYSNIILDEKQKEIMLLPPNYQTFPQLSLEKFETEVEKCMIKATWESNRESIQKEKNLVEKECKDNEDENVTKNAASDKVYDHKTKTLNLANLKATDLKNNKRVFIQMNYDDEKEIKRNNVASELKRIFTDYKNKHCDKFGNLIENNLDKEQRKTVKDLKKKMKDEELVCFKTDKTGYLALDTQANLENKMAKHIENDKVIKERQLKTIENKLNKQTGYFLNNAGENTNQVRRVKGNLITIDNQIPILSGTSKDHEELKPDETSPDVRPIMGAMVGPNVGVATITSIVIKTIADEADIG